jgi:hypothetical protein
MRPDPFEEDDIIPPWSNQNRDVMDEALRDTYERHRQVILESHRLLDHRIVDTYNFPFSRGVRVETLMHHIDQIYLDQQHAFRLKLSFGLILRNPATEEMRYFYPHNNQSIWENPMYLSSRNDFLKIRRSFRGMELEENVQACSTLYSMAGRYGHQREVRGDEDVFSPGWWRSRTARLHKEQ